MATAGQWRDTAGNIVDMFTPGAAYYGPIYDTIDWALAPSTAEAAEDAAATIGADTEELAKKIEDMGDDGPSIGSDEWFDELGIDPAKYDSFEDFLNEMGFEDVPDLVAEWGLPAIGFMLLGPLGGLLAYHAQTNPQEVESLPTEPQETLDRAVEAQTAAYGGDVTPQEQTAAAQNLADIVTAKPDVVGITGENVKKEANIASYKAGGRFQDPIKAPDTDVQSPQVAVTPPDAPSVPNISGITDAQTEADLADAEAYFSLGLDALSPDVANNVQDAIDRGYDAEAVAASAPRATSQWGVDMVNLGLPGFLGSISLPNISTPYDVTDAKGNPASFDAVGVVTDKEGAPVKTREGVLTYGVPKTAYERAQLDRAIERAMQHPSMTEESPSPTPNPAADFDPDDPDTNLDDSAYAETPTDRSGWAEDTDLEDSMFDPANVTNFGQISVDPTTPDTWGSYSFDAFGTDPEAEGETYDEPEDMSGWAETDEDADALSINFDPSYSAYEYMSPDDLGAVNLTSPDVGISAPTAPTDRSGWAADTDLDDSAYESPSAPEAPADPSVYSPDQWGMDPEAEGETFDSTPAVSPDTTWGAYSFDAFGMDPEAEGETSVDSFNTTSVNSFGGLDAYTGDDSYSTDPDTNMDDSSFDDSSSDSSSDGDGGGDSGGGSDSDGDGGDSGSDCASCGGGDGCW